MKHIKKKTLILLLAVLLGAFACVALAVRLPARTDGRYERDIIDRVRFTVEPTTFELTEEKEAEFYDLQFVLCAQKTEADFYAVLHSVTLQGIAYQSIVFQNLNEGHSEPPAETPLPAEDVAPVEMRWQATVRIAAAQLENAEISLLLRYTAGMTEQTADEHILTVPLQLTVEK